MNGNEKDPWKDKREISTYSRPLRPRRGLEIQFYPLFNFGARWEWVVKVSPLPL
jgi:hypothetical protein